MRSSEGQSTCDIESLMAAAQNSFYFQQFEQAKQILQDVIAKDPRLPGPYHILGLISEELNQPQKAASFFMLAAKMTQNDANLWAKVAYSYKNLEHYKQAIYGFSRALLNKRTIDLDLMKAICYEKLGKFDKAKQMYVRILKEPGGDDPAVAKALVDVYRIMQQQQKAVAEISEVLQTHFSMHLLHLLCELYIELKQFSECLGVLSHVHADLPIVIKVQKGVCNARTGRHQEADECFAELFRQPVGQFPELFLIVGDLYTELGRPHEALRFIDSLRVVEEMDTPLLALKRGNLYLKVGEFRDSQEALLLALRSPEARTQAKISLSKLYQEQGQVEKSIDILKTPSEERPQEFVANARLKMEQLSLHMDAGEACGLINCIADSELRLEDMGKEGVIAEIGLEQFERLLERLIEELGSYDDLKALIKKILRLKMFHETQKRLDMKRRLTEVSVANSDYDLAVDSYKFVCEAEPSSHNWGVFNTLLGKASNIVIRPWLTKINNRNLNNDYVKLLLANNYMQTGNYETAIKHYLSVNLNQHNDYIINMCLALCHLFSLNSKALVNKDEKFERGIGYFKLYVNSRKRTHYFEAYYNYARAFHYLRFHTRASYYYEKVLRTFARHKGFGHCEPSEYVRLSAHNLALLREATKDEAGAQRIRLGWL